MSDLKEKSIPLGKYVVIGEPTKSNPVYMHKGYMSIKVTVGAFKDKHGFDQELDNPCHSSDPRTTTNAVEKALGPVIDELNKFRLSLEAIEDRRFDPPYPSMNVGGNIIIGRTRTKDKKKADETEEDVKNSAKNKLIKAGHEKKIGKEVEIDKVAKNIIPRGFTVYSDIRILPGQDPKDILSIVEANIKERVNNIETSVLDEEWDIKVKFLTKPSVPMVTSRDSLIVRAIEEVTGKSAITSSYNTEGGVFNLAGSETVIWGPADIFQAHRDNEYVLAEMFNEKILEKYIQLIRRICVKGGD